MKRLTSKKIYAQFTILFTILVCIIYGIFLLTGKSFIWWGDGLAQHYPILVKFYDLLHHGFPGSLFGWSWALGLGADKLTTFSYYVTGDPFAYLIAVFPKNRIEMGYNLLVILRLFCSGLAFLIFSRQFKFKPQSQLLGSLAYTFTGYSLFVSVRHPFFLLPMILFPLLAYGIERIFRGKSWLPLALAVAVTLASNFYFAYILAIGSFAYAAMRYARSWIDHQPMPLFKTLWQLVKPVVTGFLLSAILFIPSVIAMMQSTRVNSTAQFANGYWFYPVNFYLSVPSSIITSPGRAGFWLSMGISTLTFLGIVYVLSHYRRYLALSVTLTLILVGSLSPVVAAIMNGGSTPSDRWILLGCLFFSLALMIFVDHFSTLTRYDYRVMVGAAIILVGLVWVANGFIFDNPIHDSVSYGLLFALIGVLALRQQLGLSSKMAWGTVWAIFGLNLISNGYGFFSPNVSPDGINSELLTRGLATAYQKKYLDGADKYVREQSGFYRSSTGKYYDYKANASTNVGLNNGTHDIMSYYSVQNKWLGQFSNAVQNTQANMNKPINQLDGRTSLSNLLGVKYLFIRSNQLGTQTLPYGYHKVKSVKDKPTRLYGNGVGTTILKSNNALPLAYLQTSILSQTQFNHLNGVDREQAMTYGALTTGSRKNVKTVDYHSQAQTLDYTTSVNTTRVLDSLQKVVQNRQDDADQKSADHQGTGVKTDSTMATTSTWLSTPEDLDKELATANNEKLKKSSAGKALLSENRVQLETAVRENQQIVKNNLKANEDGLHELTSSNTGQRLSYRLTLSKPELTKNTELYLQLDGIKVQPRTMTDSVTNTKNKNTFNNTPYPFDSQLQTWRKATSVTGDGAYNVQVKSKHNLTGYNQLGSTNLSDYEPKTSQLLNLGYSKTARKTVDITFEGVQGISYKSAKIIAVPMNKSYSQRMQQLKKQKLTQLSVHNDVVTGTATSDQATILTTSIPYSKGWQLTVDGHPAKTSRVNVGFVGAHLPAGTHKIKLTYQTPGLKLGELLTLGGMIIFVSAGLFQLWRRRRSE
ncbi:YfhO family protein [Levilactobacillus bambusae]|uniref:Glycosyltransferase n=1 Tax=Levilactobacillus bambusae TaxID=2024736 RepID=A0A2V1MZD3_9LACO|nr:YfhO family protein [Levilactobacillus bambusae]PWF99847.1 glycosyltransferase [Levilactobacillus bambusae]